jgi:hypothetical protein
MTQKIDKTKNADSVDNCQVIEIGIGDFAECAQWKAVTCEHAMPFGYTYLCMHPRVKDVIENTKKGLSAQKL